MSFKFLFYLLSNKHAAWFIGVLGLMLMMPSLFTGFYADDYNFYLLAMKQDQGLMQTDNLSLFDFFTFLTGDTERTTALINYGLLPWWIDRDMKLVLFRPFSELTHWFDFHVLSWPWLMHVHSLMWYALLLWAAYKLFINLTGKKQVALLGLLFFAVDATHAVTVTWIANRNAIIAAFFILMAIYYHHLYRVDESKKALLLSLAFIFLGLLSGELALSVAPILFAYACCFEDRKKVSLLNSLKAIAPAALFISGWLVFYKLNGFGADSDGGYYNDLFKQPLHFGLKFLERFPLALSMQFQPIPFFLLTDLDKVNAIVGYVIASLLIIGACLMKNRLYNFCLCALFLSCIPMLSAEAQERNLMVVGLFSALLLSSAIYRLAVQANKQFLNRNIAMVIGVGHLLLSSLFKPVYAYLPKVLDEPGKKAALSLPKDLDQYKATFILGNDLFDSAKVSAIRYLVFGEPVSPIVHIVSMTEDVSIRFTDKSMVLSKSGGLFSEGDELFRNNQLKPLKLMEPISVANNCYLTVLKLTLKNNPSTVRLKCPQPLSEYGIFKKNSEGYFKKIDTSLSKEVMKQAR